MNFIVTLLLSLMLVSCTRTEVIKPNPDYDTGLSPNSLYLMRKNCAGKNRVEIESKLGKAIELRENIGVVDGKKIIGEVYKALGDPTLIGRNIPPWRWGYNPNGAYNSIIRRPMSLMMYYYPGGDTVVGCSSSFEDLK